MNTTFKKTRTVNDYIKSLSLIAIGFAAIASGKESLIIAGVLSIIVGAVLLIVLKSGCRNTENGLVYKKHIIHFAAAYKGELLRNLENDPAKIRVDENEISNSLMLEIMHCSKASTALCQLYEYIPYSYEPCSKVYSYSTSQIENLIK